MLTTPKYRLLQSLYLGFVILDDTIFVFLIIALFLDIQPETLYEALIGKWAVFLVIAFEIFYDVLQLVVQMWLVSRVSVYIVSILYICYAIAFTFYKSERMWDDQLYVLFFSRVAAFILEVLVDFCIDLELDRDLSTNKKVKLAGDRTTSPTINDLPSCFCCLEQSEDKEHVINLPNGWEYKGSVCAWTWHDTYFCDKEVEKGGWDCNCCYCCGCKALWYHVILVPLAGIVALMLLLLTFAPWLLLICLKKLHYCVSGKYGSHSIYGEIKRKQV